MPVLHLLAGPNGAGKSSYVHDVLGPTTNLPFINADEIAAEKWPGAQVEHAYEAAELAEVQRREKITEGSSFLSETVFSHPSKIDLVADAVDAGYLLHLHVIMVPVDRYERLWNHIVQAIRIADVAEVFDNSSARAPFRLCASFEHGDLVGTPSWPKWTPAALGRNAEEPPPGFPESGSV